MADSNDASLRATIDDPFVNNDRSDGHASHGERSESDHPADEPTAGSSDLDATSVGQRIGRFVPIACIGKGGMGVVWSAYDPQLDRKVAIKLIVDDLGRGGSSHGEHAATRMLREARALAKLTDPNVVSVYDVGAHEDGLYIAMEFVDGETLDKHLAKPRPWREVLALFVAAARGLAAAHAAGLVHRDFKPSNVVVTPAGRVVVLDFGLARAPVVVTVANMGMPGLDPSATEGGALLGTPAYMSPEQWRGHAVDARSDQFNFCVALWEALCRTHPFDRTSTLTLAESVTNGRVREFPHDLGVPTRLVAALRRGLSKDPTERWPSMDALVAALGGGERRLGPLVAAAGVLAVGAVGWAVVSGNAAPDDPCATTGQRTAEVWNDARKEAGRAAFAATDLAFAQDAWVRVDAALEAYARAWSASATDACVAAQRGTIGAEQAALQTACLGDALHRLDVLVQRLGHASTEGVTRATDAVADLPQLDGCADFARLRAASPTTSDEDDAQVRLRLAELDTAIDVADHDEVEVLFPSIEAAAERIDDGITTDGDRSDTIEPGLGAEVLLARARVLWRRGRIPEALADLDRAADLAMTAGRDEMFGHAAIRIAVNLVLSEGSTDAAEAWWKMGRAANARIGRPVVHEVQLLLVGSMVAVTRHDLVRGRALASQSEALARAQLGETHVLTLRAASDNARVAMLQGDYDAGLIASEALVTAARETYGAKHPTTLDQMTMHLTVLMEAGLRDGVAEQAREILELRDDDAINVVWATLNLGSALAIEGQWDEADAAFATAHAVLVEKQRVEYRASGVTCERARHAFAAGRPEVAWTLAQQCERELRAWAGSEEHGHSDLALASGLVDVVQVAALTDHEADTRRLLAELEATFAHLEGDDDTAALVMMAAAQLAIASGDDAKAEARVAAVLAWIEAKGRGGRRLHFEALALGIDTARWAGDEALSAARAESGAKVLAQVLASNARAHPGARRRLLLAMATVASRRDAALVDAARLAEQAPVDPELDLRSRLEALRGHDDVVAGAALREAARVRSPWLRRVVAEVVRAPR